LRWRISRLPSPAIRTLNRADLDPFEITSRDAIAALQLDRMKWSLHHAYDNVARYRSTFEAAGVHPIDLRDLSDLARFPFTLKMDLRDNYPFGMFAVPRDQIARIHFSNGTTGKPTVVGYTARDMDTWASVMAPSMRASRTRPGDMVHISYGYGLFTGGLGAHYGQRNLAAAWCPFRAG
jgi:phenylacetate-CoA ligase